MPEMEQRTRFEAALTPEVYSAAWRYAWRLAAGGRGGCREEAEDLLQEALAQAWRQFGQLRERSSFRAWLLSIIRTRYLNRLRHARRRPQVAGEPAPGYPAPDGVPTQQQLEARAALELLLPLERELLQLFYLEGLSLAETGLTVGLGERVVRQRLYRARQSLRQAWERLAATDIGQPQPGTTPRRTLS